MVSGAMENVCLLSTKFEGIVKQSLSLQPIFGTMATWQRIQNTLDDGCMVSKDIGEYNTCPHLCEYCYANASKEVALRNWKRHLNNRISETIK